LVKQAFWIILLASLFLYLNASPPFLAIASGSMEPTLSRGDMIFSSPVNPDEIQVGDIVVYRVAPTFQEQYGYPTSVCHRVVKIENSKGQLYFRTKGDATGEDPFKVNPDQIIGKESNSIPYLGYLIMFPQSRQGWVFLGGLLILILVYCNSAAIISNGKKVRQALTGVSASEFTHSQASLEQKMGLMSDQVAQSMNGFTQAMSEYAKHIASHTSAIQSLALAAKHMETILAKHEAAINQGQAAVNPSQTVIRNQPAPQPIEVTPELKAAVKDFIQEYCQKHGITSVEVTPELRSAVWQFVQDYQKNPPIIQQAQASKESNPGKPESESISAVNQVESTKES
jgi:signal peptidase